MDLRTYYRKIRETEQSLAEEFPLIVSIETSEGGKAGRVTEVSRAIAAKMLLDGRAILANSEQREAHLIAEEAARIAAHKADLARRVQLAIVTDELAATAVVKKK